MKIFTILIVIVLLAGAGWYFMGGDMDALTGDEGSSETEMMEEGAEGDSMMEGEDGAMMEEHDGAMMEQGATFEVTGKNFEFSETEIRVKEGDKVTINFESTDGLHDWVIDEFEAKTDQVRPGTKTSVTFTADKAGEYEFYCSVGQHRAQGMVGKLIVE